MCINPQLKIVPNKSTIYLSSLWLKTFAVYRNVEVSLSVIFYEFLSSFCKTSSVESFRTSVIGATFFQLLNCLKYYNIVKHLHFKHSNFCCRRHHSDIPGKKDLSEGSDANPPLTLTPMFLICSSTQTNVFFVLSQKSNIFSKTQPRTIFASK